MAAEKDAGDGGRSRGSVATVPRAMLPAPSRLHAPYDLGDVEDALRRGRRVPLPGDASGDHALGVRLAAIQAMLEAGEEGRWRALANADAAGIEAVQALAVRPPHLQAVIDLVALRRLSQGLGTR